MKKILFATSEAVPFIKTGGLADVAGALPKCFDKRYFDVRVILPKYACMKQEWKDKMEYITHFYMDLGYKNCYVGIMHMEYDGIQFYFIDNEYYFKRDNFYGYFDETVLSTIAPITDNMVTKGYVAAHYLMSDLYQRRSGLLLITQLLFFLIYALLGIMVIFFQRHVSRPLQKITNGVTEFTNGNLSYKIPLNSEDEMGYLAQNLNYMADRLNRNGEYQRQFISNISHDFRSPLTSIKGYVEAMLDGTIPVEMQEKYLKIISFEAERLEKLTRGLLTLNELDIQKRMLNIQKFDINEVIKNTAASFEGSCTTRNILLELILSGHELYAQADIEQIQQVLYNLLNNAIKFSPDNSTITIETTEKNDKIFVSVKDHGIGIPKSSIQKIWERFYKIDTSRGKDQKGTGLGLAIVKEIINAHGQNINVISTEGVGSKFIFTLEKAK